MLCLRDVLEIRFAFGVVLPEFESVLVNLALLSRSRRRRRRQNLSS